MQLLQMIAFGLIAGLFAVIVKNCHPEIGMQVSICAGVVLFAIAISQFSPVVDFLTRLSEQYGINMEYMGVIFKVIGIAYITEFSVQTLKDAGENGIALKVELGGKILIAVLALPILESLIGMIAGMLP